MFQQVHCVCFGYINSIIYHGQPSKGLCVHTFVPKKCKGMGNKFQWHLMRECYKDIPKLWQFPVPGIYFEVQN